MTKEIKLLLNKLRIYTCERCIYTEKKMYASKHEWKCKRDKGYFILLVLPVLAQRCVANLAGTGHAPVDLVGILDRAKPLLT